MIQKSGCRCRFSLSRIWGFSLSEVSGIHTKTEGKINTAPIVIRPMSKLLILSKIIVANHAICGLIHCFPCELTPSKNSGTELFSSQIKQSHGTCRNVLCLWEYNQGKGIMFFKWTQFQNTKSVKMMKNSFKQSLNGTLTKLDLHLRFFF